MQARPVMILMLIEALRHRERVANDARERVPVPVWLTLGSWDPSAQGLRDWVTATINRDHPGLQRDFGPSVAAQLFDSCRIALFLDGLDEMPDALRGQAIDRLTSQAAGLRMVITSRPEESDPDRDLGPQLAYTAVVELQPVDPAIAAEYLLEGQIGATRQAWQDVSEQLIAHPDGVLARTLNTPLTLSLARAAYITGDPRTLLTSELAEESALRGHLLDKVLIAAYPDLKEQDHANYWQLARSPNAGTTFRGDSRSGLVVDSGMDSGVANGACGRARRRAGGESCTADHVRNRVPAHIHAAVYDAECARVRAGPWAFGWLSRPGCGMGRSTIFDHSLAPVADSACSYPASEPVGRARRARCWPSA